MKKSTLFALLSSAFLLIGCARTPASSSGENSSQSSNNSSSSSTSTYDADEVREYMEELAKTSVKDHLYVHYLGFNPSNAYYDQWDVWAWPYKPKEGEGYRFDWQGRTSSADRMSATGNATIDNLNYVCADIDLTKDYDGGWNASSKTMGGKATNFYADEAKTTLDSEVGIQIVQSASRTSSSGFWKNDSSNIYISLEDYSLKNKDNTTSYHVFLLQDHGQKPTKTPPVNGDIVDPFINDDGTNVTYGKNDYNNADWNDKPVQATSPEFLTGGDILTNGAGVGYQIMVSSFADSDGDGFGDIYGIEQKLDYLQELGVNVLWLTPIQLSDSYHGYDISDYLAVDPKFGSSVSPAAIKEGKVNSKTAKADYKSLIDAAHEKHMAVIMDLVLNHTSTSNNWFISSAQLEENYRGYYQWGNNQTQATDINETKYWYPYGDHVYSYYAKFGSSMPELNYAYVGTRTAVELMAKNWLEFGVDGFRMDAVKHIFLKDEIDVASTDTVISDVSASGDYSSDLTKNLNFWKELNYSIKQDYPNAFIVGENFDGHAYHVAPYYEGFDSLFDFYSYFNLTSIASRAWHGYSGGDSTSGYWGLLCSYLGVDGSLNKDINWEGGLTPYSASSDTDLSGSSSSIKYGDNWTLRGVLNTNNKYRTSGTGASSSGYSMINGAFTSNHDIARCINRIAGNTWSLNGLEAQGEVTSSNYETLDTMSTLVELTELMLPGCTWIYYGDELGMTGNLQGKTATDGYADLVYRQPMKWTADGQVGDGSMTTGYSITGSGTSVSWDDINSTNVVKSASEQTATEGSHYKNISAFAKIKSTTPALIRGNYQVLPIEAGSETGHNAAVIYRTLGSTTYRFYVNFGNTELNVYNEKISKIGARSAVLVDNNGNIVAQFGGTTGGDAPISSDIWYIVGEGSFVSGSAWTTSSGVAMSVNSAYSGDGTEYYVTNVHFTKGDVWKLTNGTDWISSGWETSAGGLANGDMKLVSDGYGGNNVEVVKTGNYDIYYKVYSNHTYSCYISPAS